MTVDRSGNWYLVPGTRYPRTRFFIEWTDADLTCIPVPALCVHREICWSTGRTCYLVPGTRYIPHCGPLAVLYLVPWYQVPGTYPPEVASLPGKYILRWHQTNNNFLHKNKVQYVLLKNCKPPLLLYSIFRLKNIHKYELYITRCTLFYESVISFHSVY